MVPLGGDLQRADHDNDDDILSGQETGRHQDNSYAGDVARLVLQFSGQARRCAPEWRCLWAHARARRRHRRQSVASERPHTSALRPVSPAAAHVRIDPLSHTDLG